MTAEAEQGIGGLEPERDSGDQADLGVVRLDQAVGQVVLDRGEDYRCVRRCSWPVSRTRGCGGAGPTTPTGRGLRLPRRRACQRPFAGLLLLPGGVPLRAQQVEADQVGECPVTERLGQPIPADLDETVGPGNLL